MIGRSCSSHELGKVIGQALGDSSHLVVICSPISESQWVNQEIKEFKRLGKSDNILCLIVNGEPNATDKSGMEEEKNVSEATRYEIGENGELVDKRTDRSLPMPVREKMANEMPS